MQRNLALLRPRYQSGAGKVKFQTAIKTEKDHLGIFPRMQFHPLDISEGKSDNGKEQLMDQELFNPQSSSVSSSRIIYTPSTFARTSLLHLQEVGSLQAVHPHVSQREDLVSFLCFIVLSGEGMLSYEEQTYQLGEGDCVFIDCRKAYAALALGSDPIKKIKFFRRL